MLTSIRGLTAATLMAGCGLAATPAFADDAPAAPVPYLKISGHIEAGITVNTDKAPEPVNLNFGHLFTDRENQPLLNQAMLTIEHPIDSSAKTANFGFRVQGMWGSDARYTHTLGVFDSSPHSINQFDIVEANVQAHLPILAAGGMDIKVGQYVTLEGAEVIDATGDFFYSHSYIFNFGIPFKHVGVMTTTHFAHGIDLYLGVDSGVNTSFGLKGDDNGAAAFHGGIGFTLGKNVTVLATTHIGPENSRNSGLPNYNSALRYLNDVVVTWKISPKLTSTTDINYIHDDGFDVSGGGVAQYLAYAVSDHLSIGARAEVWVDSQGFYVAAFPGNNDFVLAEKGLPNGAFSLVAGQSTTYGALTIGLNWKPKVQAYTKNFGIMIRPEARVDTSLGHSRPFLASDGVTGKKTQVTFGIDGIVSF